MLIREIIHLFPLILKLGYGTFHPGAALDAIEELGQACLKCHYILMVVVFIPKSLLSEWFCRFFKIFDL